MPQRACDRKLRSSALAFPTPDKRFQINFLAAAVNGNQHDTMFKVKCLQNQQHGLPEDSLGTQGSVAEFFLFTDHF
jgi:hypothetical protein